MTKAFAPNAKCEPGGPAQALTLDSLSLRLLMESPLPPGTRMTISNEQGEQLAQGKVTGVESSDKESRRFVLRIKLFAPEKKNRPELEKLVESQGSAEK